MHSRYLNVILGSSNLLEQVNFTDFKTIPVTDKGSNNIKAIGKNVFPCLFSIHNTISLSRHEKVCSIRLRFERYFSHHWAT